MRDGERAVSDVEPVPSPQDAAIERLRLKPGGECQALGRGFLVPVDDLDARVAEAGGAGHWLEPDVWIGDADSAIKAFEATWAAQSTDGTSELWLEITRDGRTLMLAIAPETTRDGTQVWRARASAAIASCDPSG